MRRPGGSLFDALRVVWQLSVEELNEPVPLAGCREDGDLILGRLFRQFDLSANPSALRVWRRCGQMQNRGAFGRGVRQNRMALTVGKANLVKNDNGPDERCKVALQFPVNTAALIRNKPLDCSIQDASSRQRQLVVYVNRIE